MPGFRMKMMCPLFLGSLLLGSMVFAEKARAAERRKAGPGEVEGFPLPYLNPVGLSIGKLIMPRECLWSVTTSEKVVALTYDDGPSAKYLPQLLDVLRHYEVKVTFFVLGDRLDDTDTDEGRARIAALQRAVQEGHEIAFHGLTHRRLTKMKDYEIREDLERLRRIVRKTLGEKPARAVRFFRPPFGSLDERTASVLGDGKLRPVNASILPGDGYFPKGWLETPHKVTDRVLRDLHPGAIVALHVGEAIGKDDAVFNAHWAASVAEELIPRLREEKYRFARLGDLVP